MTNEISKIKYKLLERVCPMKNEVAILKGKQLYQTNFIETLKRCLMLRIYHLYHNMYNKMYKLKVYFWEIRIFMERSKGQADFGRHTLQRETDIIFSME